MTNPFNLLPPRLRLFLPLLLAVIVPVLIVTMIAQYQARRDIEEGVEQQLSQHLVLIRTMLEREYDLKFEKVQDELRILERLLLSANLKVLNDSFPTRVTDQHSKQVYSIYNKVWEVGGSPLHGSNAFIDSVSLLTKGTATIFQRHDIGYVRISTSVFTAEGNRATGTFLPMNSPVVQAIEQGQPFVGRAYVVDDWYITAYKPIIRNGQTIGMLYAGDKEKDLDVLKQNLEGVKVGEQGFALVFDSIRQVIIGPDGVMSDLHIPDTLTNSSHGGILRLPEANGRYMMAYEYFPSFNLYIATVTDLRLEARSTLQKSLAASTLTGILIIALISILVWLISAENARKFYSDLEQSSEKLQIVQKALRESRHDFRTLFNSSSDDILVCDFDGRIIEANQVVSESLGIDRSGLIGKSVRDLMSENFREIWKQHLETTLKLGKHVAESEYQHPDGRQIPIEMKSRLIEYRGRQVILTIARDISERKEVEQRIMSTIIQTEENERKRFSADLHDDLGPILSTIKLYAGSLKKAGSPDRKDTVETIDELTDLAITTARQISRNIRPSILQDFGLAAAIEDFCSYINKTESIQISLDTGQYSNEFRGVEETILYHAVKELINNTIKHASAQSIRIELKSFDQQLILYYKDDGIGFDFIEARNESKGLGLNNIINKIRSMKGLVDIYSEKGKGMFLIASLNINPNR